MNKKRNARFRRARRTQFRIKRLGVEKGVLRLCVIRSARHIGAQVIASQGGKILACASSLEKSIKQARQADQTKTAIAKEVGKLLAERAKEAGIQAVASDCSGYKYHGRVAALIESARENGLVI